MKIRDILAEGTTNPLIESINSEIFEVSVDEFYELFLEGKNKNNIKQANNTPLAKPVEATRIQFTTLFKQTKEKYADNEQVMRRFAEFINAKLINPMSPFGKKDYPIVHGPMKGIMHAGMDLDISLFYRISGKNPTLVTLYGFFTHDAAGIGQPRSIPKQTNLGKKIDNTKIDS